MRPPPGTIRFGRGSTLTPTSYTVSAPAGPMRARRAVPAPEGGRRLCAGAPRTREGHGNWHHGDRGRPGHHRSSDRPPLHRPGHVLPSQAGGRRRRVRHQRATQHRADPEDHRVGRGAGSHRPLRQPQPALRRRPALREGADRHRRAARSRGDPRRRAAADPARRGGGRGEVRRGVRRRVRRGGDEGRAPPRRDGADHLHRGAPRPRAQYQPQRLRGLP